MMPRVVVVRQGEPDQRVHSVSVNGVEIPALSVAVRRDAFGFPLVTLELHAEYIEEVVQQ